MRSGTTAGDRQLGAEVRRMSLKKVRKILSDDYEDKDYQKAVLLKLVPTLLPRLNEHSGEGGEAISITWKSSLITPQEDGQKIYTQQ